MSGEFSRYGEIVADLGATALDINMSDSDTENSAAPLSDPAIVMLSSAAAKLLLSDDPKLYPSLADGFKTLAKLGKRWAETGQTPQIVDAWGHKRDVYHPLALHLHLAAYARRFESMPIGLWSACEDALVDAITPARVVENYTDVPPASEQADIVLWQTLCLAEQALLAGRDVDLEVADSIVHQVISRPGDGGSLHNRTPDESLDAWTYRELCGLHALANVALRRRNPNWAKRVEQVALYHLENTQPDHTTNQPWSVFAFLWSPKTRSFAEQQLHDTSAHLPRSAPASESPAPGSPGNARSPDCPHSPRTAGTPGTIAGLLLADAADALGAFDA